MDKSGKKRILLKIGSNTLTKETNHISRGKIEDIGMQIAALKDDYEFVIVSSGAIAAAKQFVKLEAPDNEIFVKQALASIGQPHLMRIFHENFSDLGLHTSQCLLSYSDFEKTETKINIVNTIDVLVKNSYIPIINENDTVSTEEIQFGDNDNLAAMVANLIEADYLVLLTDQEGLFSDDPAIDINASLIEKAFTDDKRLDSLAKNTSSIYGTGGMVTKIEAARRASLSGTHTIIANGKIDETFFKLFNNKSVGTFLESRLEKKIAKKKWLADNLRSCGRLILDKGASIAILEKGKSLLPIGVLEVEGKFDRGEVVSCVDSKGIEIAKGLVNYNSVDSKKICGVSSDEIESILGFMNEVNIIHRDNLVVM